MKSSPRQFLKTSALAASAFSLVPRDVLGGPGRKPPSEKLNLAGVGVGGMGQNNLKARSPRLELSGTAAGLVIRFALRRSA